MNPEVEALKEIVLKQSEVIEQILLENAEKDIEISNKKKEIETLSASLQTRQADIKELTVENKRKDQINLMMAEDLKKSRKA